MNKQTSVVDREETGEWLPNVFSTRGHGGLTYHLHSEAPAGNRRMAISFAKLTLIVFLRCIGLDRMPL